MARAFSFFALAILVALTPAAALASGTVHIMQPDGMLQTYPGAQIKIAHDVLFVTSADGKGTLMINRAACSYQGEVLVCFPTSVYLIQGSGPQKLDLTTGTVYVNMTDSKQPLRYTSAQLEPHSVMLSFSTKRGTYVSLSGTFDKVTK